MILESAAFRDFRNLEDVRLRFSPGVNVLWGANAQGKTNLLEGVYFFARGRSFRGAKERTLIRTDAPAASLAIECRGERDTASTRLAAEIPHTGRRVVTRNGAVIPLREMLGTFRAVLFCPSHLELVNGSPEDRRTFLDVALSQISRPYLAAMGIYMRALKERNALIRQIQEGVPTQELLSLYAEEMARTGAYVIAVRQYYVKRLEREAAECFDDMTSGAEKPSFRYVCSAMRREDETDELDTFFPNVVPPKAFKALYTALTHNVERELAAGTTLYGVHRDDVEILLNDRPARQYASQGQTRSVALAMKLGEGALSREVTGEQPVYLLDDVFSELDASRRSYLLSSLGERQVILTSCDPEETLRGLPSVRFTRVRAGTVEEMG